MKTDSVGNKFKDRLKQIIDEDTTSVGRYFDTVIQVLIILSVLTYSASTLPDLPGYWNGVLDLIDFLFYIIFTLEYLARIYIAKKPWKYIFSFYGIVDLLAILPFIFATNFDLRALRILRVFKLMSALKISKYNHSLRKFAIALKLIKPELTLFFIVSGIFIYLAAVGIYHFEHEAQPENFASIFHSLWWSIITLTTVGYGDVYPVTVGGKMFTFVILLIGLGIVAIPAGLIANSLAEARNIEAIEDEQNIDNNEKNS